MDELIASLRKCHSNTFVLYFKAHTFHWNVEGIHFPTYHSFFGDFYEELFGAVDPMAEEIRALGAYAATGLSDMYKHCTLTESSIVGDSTKEMLAALALDNDQIISCLNQSFKLATEQDKQGLADFIAGRIDVHKKHAWMLSASLKGSQ
jgi:starvation-inducible DNA-binding protein